MGFDKNSYRFSDVKNRGWIYLVVGIAALALSLFGYFIDSEQFFHSYLVAFVFWCTIGLGGLFFVMIHYLTNATWSVVIRRLAENVMSIMPLVAIFAFPVLFGLGDLYHWSHADAVRSDHLLQGKSAYLNVPFFIIRLVIYFIIWILLSRYLFRLSLRQDMEHNDSVLRRAVKISAPGMILFAVTVTFFSFDLLMSLDAHWYSTIFGVYVFAGSFLSLLSFITIYIISLRKRGILAETITLEHFRDLGKLIFAFLIFWGYMAFSQYFLIWYGNIPEETVWFLHRWDGSWKIISLILVFGHFVIPFFVLFPMEIKRNIPVMTVMGVWILFMHWIDIYWIVMPSYDHHGVQFSWMDITSMMGIGGFFVWRFLRNINAHPLVPINDPRLENSIKIIS
ncbi:MAG: hypothetical protein JSW64_07270 [Candidatus Zixiibacteriota bacterium]|nr:MAG: hypothetical protein JSW64_07270 [candidate division Zixibacteria bacterium]